MSLEITIVSDFRTVTFYRNNEILFVGKANKKFWKIDWTLFNQSSNIIGLFKLKQKPFHLNCKLLVEFLNGERKIDITLFYKIWRAPHIVFEYENDQFLIVFHIGTGFSFFKNDKQFAFFKKEKISLSSEKKYIVIADSDIPADLLSIISHSILIITEDVYDQSADVNVDIGNIGPELRKIDHTWRAKST
ncbi:MAG TPA: hypothetical protein VIN08_15195 [Ohtaekwangia sp.]|uniref:hypothetical protein n=1 Tax=Ohtaekwangia sp. TaxID=2066019 RepID=UPI002F94CF41